MKNEGQELEPPTLHNSLSIYLSKHTWMR